MLNLYYSWNTIVENAYIITIKGHEKSETYSKRCQQSCINVGMPYKIWYGYDGTKNPIEEPDHLKNSEIMSMFKIIDHYLTRTEVACFLSHASLWAHCVKIDQPIVILEHDAVMVNKISELEHYNSITYLGGADWEKPVEHKFKIPIHGAGRGPNFHYICHAFAYAIDPQSAKNILSYALQNGINNSADSFLRTDIFNLSYQGMFAYEARAKINDTMMLNRADDHEFRKFNPNLEL